MKQHVVVLVSIFGVISLTGMVNSLCTVKNSAIPEVFVYQCFRSTDYLEDVKKAPIDIPRLFFSNSKIPIVRDGSFTRLAKYLEGLTFFYCEIEDIEDNAFQGLTKLNLLVFPGNKLRVIKSAWFKELSNLKTVSFQSNAIKKIDDNFFSILPPLEILDIPMNKLTCLPTASFGNFTTNEFHYRQNNLTPICEASLMKWLKNTNIRTDQHEGQYFDTHYGLTKICVDKLPKSQLDEEFLNKCVKQTARDFLPAEENYTVKQVCELLKENPSPFLNCTSV